MERYPTFHWSWKPCSGFHIPTAPTTPLHGGGGKIIHTRFNPCILSTTKREMYMAGSMAWGYAGSPPRRETPSVNISEMLLPITPKTPEQLQRKQAAEVTRQKIIHAAQVLANNALARLKTAEKALGNAKVSHETLRALASIESQIGQLLKRLDSE